MVRKVRRDAINITKAAIGLGIGSAIIARSGVGGSIQPAFSTAGRFLRIGTTAIFGFHALRIIQEGTKKHTNRKNKLRRLI